MSDQELMKRTAFALSDAGGPLGDLHDLDDRLTGDFPFSQLERCLKKMMTLGQVIAEETKGIDGSIFTEIEMTRTGVLDYRLSN